MITNVPTITPLVVPASLDADDAAEFHAFGALNRLVCDEAVGLPDIAPETAQVLASWHDTVDTLRTGFVARRGPAIAGMATVAYAQEEDAQAGEFELLVSEEHWGHGVEHALLDRVEEDARARGRTVLQTWTLHRPVEAARMLVPKTGWGRVPATALSDLLQERGYALEQVERNSQLDLHADDAPLRSALADALAAAGPDYRVIEWNMPTPPALRAGYAAVLARLSTDAPSGDLEFVAERWDADRVARRDARLAAAGLLVSVAAVEHVPSGEIVAYNELLIGADHSATTHQYGTLVAKHHRGHRLGMVVKCANLLRWRAAVPASPAVSTFNAEENRPMLGINEALGFVPVSYAGAWQKRL